MLGYEVESFFADKHVNVVIPFGGGGTFYSDWQRDDPKLGRVKWEAFLTQELPPFMADRFGSDNVDNAVAGLSMSGTSALNLAAHRPDFYKAVASFSGYPTASSPGFAQGISVAVGEMGGNARKHVGYLAVRGLDPKRSVPQRRRAAQHGSLRLVGQWLTGYGPCVQPSQQPFRPLQVRADGATGDGCRHEQPRIRAVAAGGRRQAERQDHRYRCALVEPLGAASARGMVRDDRPCARRLIVTLSP